MTAAKAATEIPGYIAGTWKSDPVHSEVSFVARHLMVSKVRGRFTKFEIEIVTAEDPLQSSVSATIDASSLDTNDDARDGHVRSADILDAAQYPEITFRSTEVRPSGSDFEVEGELTLHGVTKPVTLDLEVNGFTTNAPPTGATIVGLTATTEIDRRDFGVTFNIPLDGGGIAVSNNIKITLEMEAKLQ